MQNCVDKKNIIKRLKKIEGQAKGLIKMIEEDRDCDAILMQIGAAKAGLHKAGQVILEGHLQHCVLNEIKKGNEKDVLKKLSYALEQFSRII